MGCCASQEEVQTIKDEKVTAVETGIKETEAVKERLMIDEASAVKTKAG